MEFWGVEIKPGKPLKVTPEEDYLFHISQASLGESKKGSESVPLFVKVGEQKLVVGTLTSEKLPQISCDLIFDKEFELSHNWKNGSVYVLGYKSPNMMDGGDEEIYSDFDDSEEEDLPVAPTANGIAKGNPVKNLTKPKAKAAEAKKDEPDSDDEDDEDDSEEIDMDEDSEDEESDEETPKKATPKKAEEGKKRPNDSAAKTPVQAKKAKIVTPQKSDGKKGGAQHSATPHPAKAGNKPSQSPKSGAPVSCGSCKKSFNSQVGLESHNKAKHSAGK